MGDGMVGVGVEVEAEGMGLEVGMVVGVAVGEVWIFVMPIPGGRVGGEESNKRG